MKLGVLLLLTFMLSLCSAYKILIVFPNTSKSHGILGEGYVRLLLNAGHEITYITAVPIKNSINNLKQIDVSDNFKVFDDLLDKMFGPNTFGLGMNYKMMWFFFDTFYKIVDNTMRNEEVQKLIYDKSEKFDAVIVEWLLTDMYSGFSAVFECPLIWSSSVEPHANVLSLIDDVPNPAYTPDIMSASVPPLSFFERVNEFFIGHFVRFMRWYITLPIDKEIYDKNFAAAIRKRGRIPPTYQEVKYNGSLILGNSHVSTGLAVRLPQNYKSIAGYHIEEEVPPLPKKFQMVFNESQHGVIYFSLGSIVPSNKMNQDMKMAFIDIFSNLKQTVIWKFDEKIPDLPNNIHIVDWAPQQSILAHPNCILFMTHGGHLSITEAIHFEKPIIGMPVFGDQFVNVKRAVHKGFALEVLHDNNLSTNLQIAISHMLSNPRYTERAKELSYIYHHRVAKPGAELVHWVEHVIHTKGAPELRSPALHVPWYQKQYLDLLGVVIIILYIINKIVKCFCCSRKKDLLKKNN